MTESAPAQSLTTILRAVTADEDTDIAFLCAGAINLYYDTLNLFAAKTKGADIIGWQNCECVRDLAVAAGLIVCAWGAHAAGHEFHVEEVRGWLDPKKQFHLGLTREGHPRHPLYVPFDTPLRPMP